MSYGYNRYVARSPNLSSLKAPQATVLLFEVQGANADVTQLDEGRAQGATAFSPAGAGSDGTLTGGPGNEPLYATGWLGGRSPKNPPGQFADRKGRHEGRSSFLFVDGHVKSLLPTQVSAGRDALNARGADVANGKTPFKATFGIQ